jgi:hypothetical protein
MTFVFIVFNFKGLIKKSCGKSRGSQTAVKKEVVGSVVMPVESVFSVAERLLAVKTRDESRLNQGEEPIIWQRTKNC